MLANTVLVKFASSDRKNIFVIRDTNNNIFYFRMEIHENKQRITGHTVSTIQINFHGRAEPSSQITIHFIQLLQSKLDSQAEQTLISLLQKNARYV